MKKIICITGGRGSGKSTAAALYAPPDKIDKMVVFDTEDSMSDLTHLGFKHIRMYDKLQIGADMLDELAKGNVPWVDSAGRNALVGYYDYLVSVLNDELTLGKYKYLAFDTIEPVEAAMTAAVENGRRVFGWSGTRAYGRMETEGVRPLYEGLLEAISQRGIETIVLTSHLKPVWIDDKPVLDKVKPGGRLKVLSRLSSIMLWLVPGNDPSGAPAALVLKARMGKVQVIDNRWQVQRVLPERIPVFSWDNVAKYQESPANLSSPAPGERMNSDERQMISELLTDEQMRLMILSAEQKVAETSGIGAGLTQAGLVSVVKDAPDDNTKVIAMIKAGASNADIVTETGLKIPEIIKIRRGIT